jgi:hypothetical protein
VIPPRSPFPSPDTVRERIERVPVPASGPAVEPRLASECLSTLRSTIDGLYWVCLFDGARQVAIAAEGVCGPRSERSVFATSRLVRAARRAVRLMGHSSEVEDLIVTTEHECHLVRPVGASRSLAFHLVLDLALGNVSVSRVILAEVERKLLR